MLETKITIAFVYEINIENRKERKLLKVESFA